MWLGDARLLADSFPDDLLPRVLDLVLRAWGEFLKPAPDEHEEQISKRFCVLLRQRKNERDLPFSIWLESWEPSDPDSDRETGRIDLRFLYGHRESVYFAFECKRLNVHVASGFRSGASEYVGNEGMMRFVTGKYARGLDKGGMIGYVMDADVGKAVSSVQKAMVRKAKALCFSESPNLEPCTLVSDKNVRETLHDFPKQFFTMYHLFLAV